MHEPKPLPDLSEPPVVRRRPSMVQVCLMVLPIGTVVLGIVAMIWYFQRDYVVGKNERDNLRSKDPSVESLADSLAKLSGPITAGRGLGSASGETGLRAVMSMIEGATGETNMGYRPVIQEFDHEGFTWKNLWVDTPGSRNPSEIVEVRVHYALPAGEAQVARESLPVAMAMELAHAFSGARNRRTVRFLFLGGLRSADGTSAGAEAYARLMEDRRIKVMGVVDLNGGDMDAGRFFRADGQLDGAAALAEAGRLQEVIARMANQ